jgi:MGT family glycosyltransferase
VLQDGRLSASTSTAVAGIPLISLGNAYLSPYAVDGLLGRGGSETRPYPGPPPLVGPGAEIALNVVRERYGLSAVVSSLELLIGDLNLMCDVPEYAPVQNTPDNFRYVGPIIWNGVPQRPAWLDALDPDRPTIYFTMGSTGRPEAFRVALEAFGSTEYRVMMTVGGLLQPETLQPIPPNFYLAAFGPGDVLARRADVVICHGGNGTTYQALAEGVPLVVWPFVRDQQWNARRQAELGVGLTLRELTPGAMRGAVATVLAEPSYRAAAERFRQIIASYDGPRTAAQLIHGFIGQRPSIGR